jgi:hypothetical protein
MTHGFFPHDLPMSESFLPLLSPLCRHFSFTASYLTDPFNQPALKAAA